MALELSHTTVNALDAYAQSVWWGTLLGYHEDPQDPNEPDHEECMIFSPDGSHRVLFIEVPDAKDSRNRVHFDLRPTDRGRDAEVERVLGLGATRLEDRRTEDGRGWVVAIPASMPAAAGLRGCLPVLVMHPEPHQHRENPPVLGRLP